MNRRVVVLPDHDVELAVAVEVTGSDTGRSVDAAQEPEVARGEIAIWPAEDEHAAVVAGGDDVVEVVVVELSHNHRGDDARGRRTDAAGDIFSRLNETAQAVPKEKRNGLIDPHVGWDGVRHHD